MISFQVYGLPTPQGSKKAIRVGSTARLVESAGGRHAEWRNAVAERAAAALDKHGKVVDACHVSLLFRFPMPRSRPARVRREGVAWKTTAPDGDKLARAVLDGLQAGGLLADDALAVRLAVEKVEVVDGWTGCHVEIGTVLPIASRYVA